MITFESLVCEHFPRVEFYPDPDPDLASGIQEIHSSVRRRGRYRKDPPCSGMTGEHSHGAS